MTRKEQAQASRAGLVEAARQCFTEYGYEATTVAEVLQRAGMARGALYHYFPGGKRELFEAVFDLMNDGYHDQRDALIAIDSPLDRIHAGFRLFLELCTEPDFARIMLVDAPQIVPGQSERGSTYELLRGQLIEAAEIGETHAFDADMMASALYGAARSVGEVVMTARSRKRAVDEALRSLAVLLDGLRSESRVGTSVGAASIARDATSRRRASRQTA